MYKTVFIPFDKGGFDIQEGKTQQLDDIINEWTNNGYEFVSITSCSWALNSERCNFILVFKSKN